MPNFILGGMGQWTGAAQASIPIEVPPGPNGHAPALNLAYSSNIIEDIYFQEDLSSRREAWAQIQASPYGYGWSLSGVPEIRRVPAVSSPWADDPNGGYELSVGGKSYRLINAKLDPNRDESDDNRKVYHTYPRAFMYVAKTAVKYTTGTCGYEDSYQEDRWEVITQDGTHYEFGSRDNFIVDDSTNCNWQNEDRNAVQMMVNENLVRPGRWFATRITDTHGNMMRLTYRREEGDSDPSHPDTYDTAVTLSQVSYGGSDESSHRARVNIVAQEQERDDCTILIPPDDGWTCDEDEIDFVGYRSKYLVDRIEVQIKDRDNHWENVRVYNLDYLIHVRDNSDLPTPAPDPATFRRALLERVVVSNQDYPEEPRLGTPTPSPTPTGTAGPPELPAYEMEYDRASDRINWLPLARFSNGYGGIVEYEYSDDVNIQCDDDGTTRTNPRRPVKRKSVSVVEGATELPVSESTFAYTGGTCTYKFVHENEGAYDAWYEFLGYGEVTETFTDTQRTSSTADDEVLEHTVTEYYRCREEDIDCDELGAPAGSPTPPAPIPVEPHPEMGQVRRREVWDSPSGQLQHEEELEITVVDLAQPHIGVTNPETVTLPWGRLDREERSDYAPLNAVSVSNYVSLTHVTTYDYETEKQNGDQWGLPTEKMEFVTHEDYYDSPQVPYRTTRYWYLPKEDIDGDDFTVSSTGDVLIADRVHAEAVFNGDSSNVGSMHAVRWNYYDDASSHETPVGIEGAVTKQSLLEPISSLPSGVTISGCSGTYNLYRTSDVEYEYTTHGNVEDTTTFTDYGYVCIVDPGGETENIYVYGGSPTQSRVTTVLYEDKLNALPRQSTNPEGHVSSLYYYGLNSTAISTTTGYFLGSLHQDVDPNTHATDYLYDELGRVVKVVDEDDSTSSPTIAYRYSDDDYSNPFPTLIEKWIKREASATPWTDDGTFERTLIDGLGRVLETQRPDHNWDSDTPSGQDVLVFKEYDAKGRVVTTTNPFTKTAYTYVSQCGEPGQSACVNPFATPAASVPESSTTYDTLGRTLDVTDQAGETELRRYGVDSFKTQWIEYSVDRNQHLIERSLDSLGRLKTVREYVGDCGKWGVGAPCTSNQWVYESIADYVYDILDRLALVVDDSEQETYIEYDGLGRKTEVDDPSLGVWNYDYDGAGNLTEHTDARSQRVCYDYDDLDRVTGKRYIPTPSAGATPGPCTAGSGTPTPGTPGPSFGYDEWFAGNGKTGQRTSMNLPDGTWYTWHYNESGELETEKQYMPGTGGGLYVTDYEYKADSSISLIDRPDGFEDLLYTYNPAGLDRSYNANPLYGIASTTYIDDTTYEATGLVNTRKLGSGSTQVQLNQAYDPDTLRLTQTLIKRVSTSTELHKLGYDYDAAGNVTSITDTLAGGTRVQGFGYDEYNRLTSAVTSGGTGGTYSSRSYAYDGNGNISDKAATTYAYHSTKENAVRKVFGSGATATPPMTITAAIASGCTWSVWVDVWTNGTYRGSTSVPTGATSQTAYTIGNFPLTGDDIVDFNISSGGFGASCWLDVDKVTINGVEIEAEGGLAALDNDHGQDGQDMQVPNVVTVGSEDVIRLAEKGLFATHEVTMLRRMSTTKTAMSSGGLCRKERSTSSGMRRIGLLRFGEARTRWLVRRSSRTTEMGSESRRSAMQMTERRQPSTSEISGSTPRRATHPGTRSMR